MNLGEAYRELYERHESLKAGHATVNRVARRLDIELREERARSRRQLRYILNLRRYLRDEYGICVSLDFEDSTEPSDGSSSDRSDRDSSSPG